MSIPIFDGHNDTLTQIYNNLNTPESRSFFEKSAHGHIDMSRAAEGNLCGGFFAIFCANPEEDQWPPADADWNNPNGFIIALPPEITQAFAADFVDRIIDQLYQWEKKSNGSFGVVNTLSELQTNRKKGVVSAILHFEGVEALHPDLSNLDDYYQRGLRSVGPVWSRSNAFGHGVPFAFPSSPDTGPGLTQPGKDLVAACNEKGILLDVSHLNEKGFWDIAQITSKPIVATHCAAWSLSKNSRNLNDKQLDAIAESGGIIGVNFCKNFLREDGSYEKATSYMEIVRHLSYLVGRVGIEHVAFGSDFDGAKMPTDLPDVSHLPHLMKALEKKGFTKSDLEAVAYKNWERILEETWK